MHGVNGMKNNQKLHKFGGRSNTNKSKSCVFQLFAAKGFIPRRGVCSACMDQQKHLDLDELSEKSDVRQLWNLDFGH